MKFCLVMLLSVCSFIAVVRAGENLAPIIAAANIATAEQAILAQANNNPAIPVSPPAFSVVDAVPIAPLFVPIGLFAIVVWTIKGPAISARVRAAVPRTRQVAYRAGQK